MTKSPLDTELNLAVAKLLGWTNLRIVDGGLVTGYSRGKVQSGFRDEVVYASSPGDAFEAHRIMCQRWVYSRRQVYFREIQIASQQELGSDRFPAWPDVFSLITARIICVAIMRTELSRPDPPAVGESE